MVDKHVMASHFARAAGSYADEAEAQCRIIDRLVALMREHDVPRGKTVYEIGCGVGLFTRKLLEHIAPKKIVANDICYEMAPFVETLADNVSFVQGDAETLPIPAGTELVASSSAIQWFRDIPQFVATAHRTLPRAGFIACSTFGEKNFREIRTLTGSGLPYHTRDEYADFLTRAGFEILHLSDETITLEFDNALHVLRHLRYTGVGGIGATRLTPAQTRRFCRDYERDFATPDGKIPLTYHPVYVVARKA